MDIKSKIQTLHPNIQPRDIKDMSSKTTSIYETIALLGNRAGQISVEIKKELQGKLDEFANANDVIEEVLENKEQIEISKFYERLPNPSIIAIEEFLKGNLEFQYKVTQPSHEE